MTTSGTVAFNPDLNELIEEAYEMLATIFDEVYSR